MSVGTVSGPPGEVDRVSTKILSQIHPILMKEWSPRSAIGDGNCFYRAVSLALYSTEEHHVYLRIITTIEMIEYRDNYDTASPSYAHTITDTRILTPDYDTLIMTAATLGSYSELMHFYALSAALAIPLSSFCPLTSFTTHSLHPYTVAIYGRGVRRAQQPSVNLLWTMAKVPRNMDAFKPDHICYFARVVERGGFVEISTTDCMNSGDKDTDNGSEDYEDEEKELEDEKMEEIKGKEMEEEKEHEGGLKKEEKETDDEGEVTEGVEGHVSDDEDIEVNAQARAIDRVEKLNGGKFLSFQAALEKLTNPDPRIQHAKVPNGIKENVFFLIDNVVNMENHQNGKKRLFEDDCGAWDTSNAPTVKNAYLIGDNSYKYLHERGGLYCREKQEQGARLYIPYDPQPAATSVLHVHRHYATLKANANYKKKITWISDSRSQNALVEYMGTHTGRLPHGNTKSHDDSYCRTPAATLAALAVEVKSAKNPKQIYNKLLLGTDVTQQPRNTKQVHNKKYNDERAGCDTSDNGHRANVADEVLSVINMTQSNSFVRSVTVTKNKVPAVILYDDEQISLIKSFCFNKSLGSVLSFDKTYNLGAVFVTTSVFTNKALLRRMTEDDPIFIGPMFLHGHSDFESFAIFLSHLSACFVDSDSTQLKLGSDEEHALVKAMRFAFPRAQLVTCTRHLKDNAIRYLQDKTGTDVISRNSIISSIFGDEGLTSASSLEHFDDKAASLLAGLVSSTTPAFANYFSTRLSPLLRDNVIAGHPSWTSNNVESMNHVFKQAVNWRPQMLPDLVIKLHTLVRSQIQDSHRAIFGRGDYKLRPTYATFRVSAEAWDRMSDNDRTKLVRKCFVIDPKTRTVNSTNGKLTVIRQANAGEKKNQRKRKRCAKTATPMKQAKVMVSEDEIY
jgi:hypothetical protein